MYILFPTMNSLTHRFSVYPCGLLRMNVLSGISALGSFCSMLQIALHNSGTNLHSQQQRP